MSLTHKILLGQEDVLAAGGVRNGLKEVVLLDDSVQEEKKCCIDAGNGCDFPISAASANSIDQTHWDAAPESEEYQKLYDSLGRRTKARLTAFFAGVEFAVPGVPERSSSPQSQKSQDSSSSSSLGGRVAEAKTNHAVPPRSKQEKPKKIRERVPAAKKPGKQHAHNKNEFSTSPVLTSLNNHGKALLLSAVATKSKKKPQIREKELLIRLELYIRSLYRVRSLQKDCVIVAEPDRAIKARVELIVSAFVTTVGCVRSMSPVLARLLTCLTKELLAVEYLGEGLVQVIRRIVNEYEHGTSFASLAFLSSPEASAETRLTPMVLKYIRYLQSDWKSHERECELERMLASSLDSNMRRHFKTVEFQSIGHLLEVCQDFRNELQNIELPPSAGVGQAATDPCNDSEAVRQAVRDLQREVITINGHVLPPVTSRKDLINLLSQSLNSRSLTASSGKKKSFDSSTSSSVEKSESCPSFISTSQSGDMDNDDSSLGDEGESRPVQRKDSKAETKKGQNRRASFHLSTVDILTRRLLIAAGRTGTGGDAYFIVRDLFGDEDVEVVPAKVLPHHVRASRVGSIEIQVRLASVTIKCHGSFDIYPKSLVGCCEPLIQLHTTSSETIYLQELRSCDSSSEDGRACLEDDGSRSSDGMENLVLQERQSHKTGWRMLAIRPALYEKVQVWNTPS